MRLAPGIAALAVALAASACTAEPPSPCTGIDTASPGATAPSNVDPELAGRFPDTADGEPLEVETFCLNTLGGGLGILGSPSLLDEIGVEPGEVSYATNTAPPVGADPSVRVAAYRYHGADEDRIRSAILDAFRDVGREPTERQIGGKTVHEVDRSYHHVADDTLYVVEGDEAAVEDVVAALP